MSGFVHLHLHSEYSLLDGACRISEIPKRALECGHNAVALTDHGAMYGAVEFYRACKEAGVKAIIGCEVYVAPGSRLSKSNAGEGYAHHMVLLCKNEIGYKNLIYLVSKAFTEGFYSKPRVDDELLKEHSEGLIALSGCLAGKIPSLISGGNWHAAKEYALRMKEIFGKDNFYIELQNHGMSEQLTILPELVRLAEETDLEVVATNDCHYLRKSDAETQAVLMCIQTNRVITEGRPVGFESDEFYYKSTEEMKYLFGSIKGAVENTQKIADRCNFEFNFEKTFLPKYKCPKGITPEEYLRELTYKGLEKRIEAGDIDLSAICKEKYEDRAEYELSVIEKMGYSDYFLIVQDYVGYAKSQNIPVGPGRGSGAGSLVAYLLNITDIDSIKFGLLFERFLNPERISMPDIDVDFCYNRRDEVIRYVGEKYGSAHVSQIVTFGTLAARAAVRDSGRALGMAYGDVDRVARAVPHELNITIADALDAKDSELRSMYESSAEVKKLIDTAVALEGMPRNISVHAAGIVITDEPVSSYVPQSVSNGTVVTQYDMDTIAKLGLLKFDFLGLRYLTIINDAQLQIREREKSFDISSVPHDDKATFDLIGQGNTSGVFQLESGGMRQMLSALKPKSLDDILAAIALYRPGPMDSIPQYIASHNSPENIEYKIPELEPILKSTYGCIVYQEQVMDICRMIGGYSYGHADVVRRAMSKKKAEVMEAERESFTKGAEDRGISREAASSLFDDMTSFANYAFNKSHAAAYAVISYRTAYLKAHYPREYFAALLTSVLGNASKIAEYVAECGKAGIKILPPDINESRTYFHVSDKNIRFGLLALKNLGKQLVDSVIYERGVSRFVSFDDFAERMAGYDINKRQVETLVKVGAFDSLGIYRSRIAKVYEQIIDGVAARSRNNISGQMDMFSALGGDSSAADSSLAFSYPDIPEYSVREMLNFEKEYAGMYFSGHLLDSFDKCITSLGVRSIAEIINEASADGSENRFDRYSKRGEKVRVAGIITSVTRKTTKKEEKMAFLTLEDRYGEIECVAFPNVYKRYAETIKEETAVFVEGELSQKEEEDVKILISGIAELVDNSRFNGARIAEFKTAESDSVKETPKEQTSTAAVYASRSDVASGAYLNLPKATAKVKKLYLRVPDMKGETFKKVLNLLEIFEGSYSVVCYDSSSKKYYSLTNGVNLTGYVMQQLAELLGNDNVVYK